ncbi:MAG: type II toxin-antitoxin system YoeB family toxin [Firmicutes bacterium]|nr:type II toxin-antitoxin system YoeB family toxin [Bacillota bacterium]
MFTSITVFGGPLDLLIRDTECSGIITGIDEPETLRSNLHGEYNSRINKNRLAYHPKSDRILNESYKRHYDD